MPTVQYPLRSFTVVGFTPPVITDDVYTNSIINGLYNVFSCCYGSRVSKVIQNQKKGIKSRFDQQTKYLLMALYVMRRWYNGGFKFLLPVDTGNGFTLSIYYESGNNLSVLTSPLVVNVTGNNYSQLISNLINAMPPGWTATLITDYIYVNAINPTTPFFYCIVENGFAPDTLKEWAELDYNPCVSYKTMQNIIQNCLRICGCVNCATPASIEKDNIYVPVGISPVAPFPNPTNYNDNIYFT